MNEIHENKSKWCSVQNFSSVEHGEKLGYKKNKINYSPAQIEICIE
jgi:hypothetical protein